MEKTYVNENNLYVGTAYEGTLNMFNYFKDSFTRDLMDFEESLRRDKGEEEYVDDEEDFGYSN